MSSSTTHELSVPPPPVELLGPIETRSANLPVEEIAIPSPLTLDQSLGIALQKHPELAAVSSLIQSAQGQVVQAGLYPNPLVGYRGDQVGSRGAPGGQQGPFISQELVTGGKLQVAQSAAMDAMTATQWQAITTRFNLEAKVRSAFYEVLTAQREVSENEAIVKIAEENLEASRKIEQAGRGSLPDVLRARVELESNKNRLIAARKRLEAAWPLLINAMGLTGVALVPVEGNLESTKPQYDLNSLQRQIAENHSEIKQLQASVAEAEKLLSRARLENVPNLDLQVQPLYDYTESVGQVSFEVGMKLPIWNKNQGNIQSAEAEHLRRIHELENTRLKLNERTIQAYQRYVTAREQAGKFEKDLIPQAKEALRLTKAAFESGDAKYDYTALLDAQRTLAQARLNYVQTLGEFWKATAEIKGLLQQIP
ncbi:MAG: TolC family protein [Planctomycetia bacterium]|nr:TolC family protein [Planctomycetia bacterium]